MATATRGNPVGPTIDDFLVKLASHKSAEANTEPGSIGGPTAHPVKNVEDRTQDATEGERSSENSADVKKDQGSPGVDSTPEAKAASFAAKTAKLAKRSGDGPAAVSGSAADDQIQIGTNKQPTGDDPSVETSSAKGGKTDPGSDHPARTDNDQLDGGKYAFDANASFDDLSALVIKCGEDMCAILGAVPHMQAAPQNGRANTKAAGDVDPRLAGQAGWELAGLLTGEADKQAVDALVVQTVAQIMKSGEDKAARVSAMLNSFKAAEEEGEMPPEDPAGGGGAGGMGGMGAASDDGGEGGGDEAAMMAAMGGGAGGGGGGGGDEAELEQLLALLESKGIDPGELLAALQAEGGGGAGGGGMPPDGGGMPGGGGGMPPMSPAGGGGGMPPGGGGGGMPPGGGGLPPGMDVAAADRRGTSTKQSTDRMREVLEEIVARSRR